MCVAGWGCVWWWWWGVRRQLFHPTGFPNNEKKCVVWFSLHSKESTGLGQATSECEFTRLRQGSPWSQRRKRRKGGGGRREGGMGGGGEGEEAASSSQAGGGQGSIPFRAGLCCVWHCAKHQGPHVPCCEWLAKSRDKHSR